MGTSSEEENAQYAAFLEKVEKTIYVDNLSPQVTEAVMKAAFNQFGNVVSVQFIPNYLEPKNMPQAALVEMENPKQAQEIIMEMGQYPFMILGMPRPARARAAKLEMFDERPRKPGRRTVCRWVDSKDPDFDVAKKIEHLVRKHAAETSIVLEQQLAEEEKLANQQSEMLKAHYRKYELLDSVLDDGTAKRLARHYNMPISDV
ncbi:uncharacterized protein LOC105157216 [Sesamum indicum]|uniref:Uncharacterized protein LOC105157216 n=1 Tax=Sesamum indicum TaxID=4182 RepID=A0A6I9SPB0_SESIN|nr:uncharacterized protein LOC105157216 [Sesamum indicum]XP_011071860.1 uncharacterized protein LOC105157216 [Sesamum indicum]